jgi:hypothetical protein
MRNTLRSLEIWNNVVVYTMYMHVHVKMKY